MTDVAGTRAADDFDEVDIFDLVDADLIVGDWVAAVALQHQRLRQHRASLSVGQVTTMSAAAEWMRQERIDARVLVLALGQLTEAADALRERAPRRLVGDIDDALARFNDACPDLRAMRNAVAHWGQHLLGHGHRQGQSPHMQHEVQGDSMIISIDANHHWLAVNFGEAAAAAAELGRTVDAVVRAAVRGS